MTEFTPFASLFGGALIGLSAVLLMAFNGRIAGMTGIVAGIIPPLETGWMWRAAFLAGAILAPALLVGAFGDTVGFDSPTPVAWLIAGGIIVGIGVQFGSGCTSGHGICGIARLSPRSIVATLTFMASTAATVFVIRHVLGGL
ncbi:membrane protein [Devosia pacifica]|uniref:Membrane protein n=1 Tax=Devosia pacifica TaxID=1335967 RepID=A0A918S0G7_9HYPH|nr:YeeE/YedE thiosulfate transporter family protein [Devosia pacifica]GHA18585.1 membrane protein [Devosia pacifica]